MSEHIWAQEQVVAYIAGGLAAEEKERFEAHLRECPECASELERNRVLDRGLESLFAPARPGGALEDRMVYSLRMTNAAYLVRLRWPRKVLYGVAASLGLGMAGASVAAVARDGGLSLPGAGRLDFDMPGFATLGGMSNRAQLSAPSDSVNLAAQAPAENSDVFFGSYTGWKDGQYLDEFTHLKPRPGDQITSMDSPGVLPPPPSNIRPGMPTTNFGGGQSFTGGGAYRSGISGGASGGISGGAGGGIGGGGISGYGPAAGGGGSIGGGGFGPGGGGFGGNRGPGSQLPVRGKPITTNGAFVPQSGGNGTPTDFPPIVSKIPYLNRLFSPSDHRPLSDGDDKNARSDLEGLAGKGKNSGKADSEVATNSGSGKVEQKYVGGADSERTEPAAPQKIIIRTGEIEFEINSFDDAVANVIKLVTAIKGGYVATVNSEKLANGKVKGSIVVRVPPEALDKLVLDLRSDLGKTGELKGQRIGSQDITKQYTDTESRLKAARTMETRLLQIIKDGKGEIKQLLDAERELGIWRTKIEEMEGELRYYGNQVALSTLTITLAEKEIRSAAGITESERVQAGLEVEDVEKAQQQLLAAVTEAKGRVTKSEMKQLGSGQFNGTVDFEVAPERAGAIRDRLRQLGVVARLEIDRVQKAEGGTAQKDSKVTRGDTQYFVQLYNVARMAARETTTLQLAAPDVAAAYQSIKNAVIQAKGRILRANLDEQDRQNVNGTLEFELRRADEAAVQTTAIDAAGDVLSRVVSRSDDGDSVTDAKVHYQVTLTSSAHIPPRATYTLGVEVPEVEQAISVLSAQVAGVKGRVVDSGVSHQRNGQVTGKFVCDVPLAAAASLAEQFKSVGSVHTQQVANDLRAPDGKLALARIDVTLANGDVMVAKDNGLWPQIHKGLVYSANFLLVSLTWVIFGLCAVLPWAVVGYIGYRLIRWMSKKPA